MYGHILVPTDGSEFAHKGVAHGLALAKRLGSKVTVIVATEPFPTMGRVASAGWIADEDDIDRYDSRQKKFAGEVLKSVQTEAEKLGVEAGTLHVPDEWAAAAIVDCARELGCDLIVMASHGRRGIDRLMLGSQTAEVVNQSIIPVLVVR
ncbi:universal stress protein [Aquamicrobium sp. LC103]|uniref:universal stress protein n=1 Tax=Aquamicrobium sp. LC103 TaxID=1120658 RepID=UPI00063EA9AF|nr:universal stress protein [Aquamicrobium sp. LC103]TKT77425.1 universal stress protein [Aquamicrobium sp. LC103]